MVGVDPVDQTRILAGGMALVPDYAQQQLERTYADLRNRNVALENEATAQQIRAAQTEEARRAAFRADYDQIMVNPDDRAGVARLIARYPEFAKPIKDTYDALDASHKQDILNRAAQIYASGKNGRWDLGANILRAQVEADKKAGQPVDPLDQELLRVFDGGTEVERRAALGIIRANLAAATGVDHFAATTGKLNEGDGDFTLAPGSGRYRNDGTVIAERPFAPRPVTVGEGDTVVEYAPGTGGGGDGAQYTGGWTPRRRNGGDNDDAAVDAKIGGASRMLGVDPDADISGLSPAQIAQAMTFGEGGKGTLADRNNNPGNIRGSSGEGGFAKYPSKEAGLSAAAALVARKLRSGQTTVRTLIEGVPVAGAAGGGPRVIAQGAPKQQFRTLTPEEKEAQGLDQNTQYQMGPNGQITAIGGPRSQLKPWPSNASTAYSENKASLRNIQNALSLLDPKNRSPDAQRARKAIGPGTGWLGDAFTQWNDPKGADFRALIGQIGGLIIKDTSGAAVSASEDARLSKWVPLVTDTPANAASKLRNLQREITQRNQAMQDTFSEEQGYRSMGTLVRVRSVQEAQRLPKGTHYVAPNGQEFIR